MNFKPCINNVKTIKILFDTKLVERVFFKISGKKYVSSFSILWKDTKKEVTNINKEVI